jgi:hypothetical protein
MPSIRAENLEMAYQVMLLFTRHYRHLSSTQGCGSSPRSRARVG